jgi:uracil-DNA glycosylase family 4
MTVDADEARALAHAFARQLEHLREFRGVFYVSSGPMPEAVEPIEVDVATAEPEPEPEPPRPTEQPPPPQQSSAEQWPAAKKLAYLRERNVGDCQRCPLARTRRNIVFGVGNPEADVMFVGEAPGADEDRLGEPFVGAAGQRLDQWIERIGLRRPDVYIANVLKCRPPGNRDPQPVEIERCSPFLHAQIRAIEPKVLIALGRFAGCLLLEREYKLWEMRGKVHSYREPKSGVEIPLLVTYHPAYVLRSEQRPPQGRPDRAGAIKSEDDKVLADLARAVSLLDGGHGRGQT